jgi:hypothetical protein
MQQKANTQDNALVAQELNEIEVNIIQTVEQLKDKAM